MTAQEKIEIENRLTRVEERAKSNTHQIEDLKEITKEIKGLATSVVQLTEQMKSSNDTMTEIKNDVKAMQKQPQKLIMSMETAGLTAIISAVVGAVMALIL